MSDILAWLWDGILAALYWPIALLGRCIARLAALAVAHWLMTLWIILAAVAVVLYLWAQSRISHMKRRVREVDSRADWALSRGAEAYDEARRVKKELAQSDNELRRQRDEAHADNQRLRDINESLRDDLNRRRWEG